MGILSDIKLIGCPDIDNCVDLYVEMIKSMRLIDTSPQEKIRFHKLESRVNEAWKKLNRQQQVVAIDRCVKLGVMSEKVSEVLKLFDGKIDKI